MTKGLIDHTFNISEVNKQKLKGVLESSNTPYIPATTNIR